MYGIGIEIRSPQQKYHYPKLRVPTELSPRQAKSLHRGAKVEKVPELFELFRKHVLFLKVQ